jgi:hypothetical protein
MQGEVMSRRVLLRGGLLLVAVLACALLALPDVRWPLWGRLRGEAFYRGRPTSYWAERLHPKHVTLYCEHPGPDPMHTPLRVSVGVSPPPWWRWTNALRRDLGLSPAPPHLEVVLDERDQAGAVPVLVALLKEDDEAAETCVYLLTVVRTDSGDRAVVPALVQALGEKDPRARERVARALERIDPQAAAQAGVP